MKKYEKILDEDAKKVFKKMKKDLIDQIQEAIANNNIQAISTIAPKFVDELSDALTEVQKTMFDV